MQLFSQASDADGVEVTRTRSGHCRHHQSYLMLILRRPRLLIPLHVI